MRTLDTNDWIFLNSIIYKIYTMNNIDEMRGAQFQFIKSVAGSPYRETGPGIGLY